MMRINLTTQQILQAIRVGVLLAFVLILVIKTAEAAVFQSQTNSPASETVNGAGGSAIAQELGTGIYGSLSAVQVYIDSITEASLQDTNNALVSLIEASVGSSWNATGTQVALYRYYASSTVGGASTTIRQIFSRASSTAPYDFYNVPYQLDPSKYYFLAFTTSQFTSKDFKGSDNSNAYSRGEVWVRIAGGNWTTPGITLKDLYFILSDSRDPPFLVPDQPSPSSTLTACSDEQGFLAESSCQMFTFLFVPNADSITNLTSKRSELLAKAPFGYFTLAKTKWDSLSVSATGTPAVEVAFMSSSLPLLDFAETESMVGSISMDLIRDVVKWALWFGFLGYLVFRIMGLFKAV